jgi:hypothetical protein
LVTGEVKLQGGLVNIVAKQELNNGTPNMKTDETITAIVVESYSHGENQIVIALSRSIAMHHFLFLPKHPDVNFGDVLLMNPHSDKYWVYHGNPHLTYRIFPHPFPGTLLLELIQAQINGDSK